MKKISILFMTVSLTANLFGYAGQALSFLKTPLGARAISMASAFTAVSDDPAAVYFNPAGLSQIKSNTVYFTKNILSLDRHFTFLSFVKPALLIFDTTALNILHAGVFKIKKYDEYNNYIDDGEENNTAIILSLAKTYQKISIGINQKFIYSRLIDQTGVGLSLDFALLYLHSKKLKLGLSMKDFLNFIYYPKSKHSDHTSLSIRAGISYYLFNKFMLLSADIEKTNIRDEVKLYMGLELNLPYGFTFRTLIPANVLLIGLQNVIFEQQLTLGFGFNFYKFNIEYAYRVDEFKVGDTHIFSLSFSF